MPESVVEVLERLGGVATYSTLVGLTSRAALTRAQVGGEVVKLRPGRYALPQVGAALATAARVGGIVASTDAAVHHGWEVLRPSVRPHLCVPRGRRLPPRLHAQVHWVALRPGQHDGRVTDELTTLEQSLRWLSFDEALAVADSALRHGFPTSALHRVAEAARGPGSRQLRRVAAGSTSLAANPFESALRAICLDVPGLRVRPQVWVNETARSDLVDERLRIVIEADSFTWHGGRRELARDARRYNRMVCESWWVLRFAFEHVVGDRDYVHGVLTDVTAAAQLHTHRRRGAPSRALVAR